jgi:hypothetical protein
MGKALTHLPAIAFGIASGLFLAMQPDVEKYLKEHVPGNHMSEAFNELNETTPYFMLFATGTQPIAFLTYAKHASPIYPYRMCQ